MSPKSMQLHRGRESGHDPEMRRLIGRAQHFRDTLMRPLWAWVLLPLVGAIGNAQTIAGLLPKPWGKRVTDMIALPNWDRDQWIIAFLAVLLIVMFEGSYRRSRRIEAERDDALSKLAAIAEERALEMVHVMAMLSAPPKSGRLSTQLQGVEITLANIGGSRLRYEMLWLTMSGGGQDAKFPPFLNNGGAIGPGLVSTFKSGMAHPPLLTKTLNHRFVVDFECAYDTIPPTRRRTFGRKLQCTNNWIVGPKGKLDYVILEEREG